MPEEVPVKTLQRYTSWKAGFTLLFLSILLTSILLEVGLRVNAAMATRREREVIDAGKTPAGEFWAIYDPELGYRQNPKFGDLNSDGLRDHPIGPKADRFRMLLLGDSIAFYGDTVDDTFVGHLRTELRKTGASEPLDIINAGIKGFTNYQELQYLKKYGLQFKPDLVGVQFCLNDLHKFLHSFRVENGKIVYGSYQFSSEALNMTPRRSPTLLERVVDKSYLMSWIRMNSRVFAKLVAWKAHDGFSFDYRVDINTAWRDGGWKDIESQFEEMLELARQHHFKMFVVVVPVGSQYNRDYLVRNRDYVLKPQRKLREICERLSIPFYDLYPDMNESLFLNDGIHLTKEGRQLVGQRLAFFLAQSDLIPARQSNSQKRESDT